jgi:hypothetical protein
LKKEVNFQESLALKQKNVVATFSKQNLTDPSNERASETPIKKNEDMNHQSMEMRFQLDNNGKFPKNFPGCRDST